MPTQATPTPKRKPGRPKGSTNAKKPATLAKSKPRGLHRLLTTQEQASITDAIIQGSTLRKWLADNQINSGSFYRSLREDEHFARQYALAREDWSEGQAEEFMDIIQQVRSGTIDPQAARVAMDGIKWLMGKRSGKWQDKATVEHTGANGSALPTALTVEFVASSNIKHALNAIDVETV